MKSDAESVSLLGIGGIILRHNAEYRYKIKAIDY